MVKEILTEIKKYQTIIIHRHVNPDGDAYGSSVGLKKWIQLNYPDKEVYVVGKGHPNLDQLGKMDVISDNKYQGALVIVTDCANVERIDDQRYSLGDKLIKIDHHPDATPYGVLSWVDVRFTSASEMVALLVKEAKLKINQDVARTIYYGIVTDSLRFVISTTTPRTFELAAYLTSTGFDLDELYRSMYKRDLTTLQAQSELIQNMQVDKKVGAIYLTNEVMNKYNIPYANNGMFANLLKDIDGIDIWVTFAANEDKTWRVEFRSKGIPVNGVATKWGGGGHKQASGAIIANLDDAQKIVRDLQKLITNY